MNGLRAGQAGSSLLGQPRAARTCHPLPRGGVQHGQGTAVLRPALCRARRNCSGTNSRGGAGAQPGREELLRHKQPGGRRGTGQRFAPVPVRLTGFGAPLRLFLRGWRSSR